ncbi:MAG: hypothetical protein ACUVS2_05440 [Candidatus Flexifilum sp.]
MRSILLLLLLLTGCASAAPAPSPTLPPDAFPTMTPGRVVIAPLPSPLPTDADALAPEQAAAAPPPTPDRAACPPPNAEARLASDPAATASAISAQLAEYFSAGGSPTGAADALRARGWIGGQGGFVSANLDLTGEGRPEILAAFRADSANGPVGALAVFACADRAYRPIYLYTDAASVPQIIATSDLNNDARPDLLFTAQRCADDGACVYRTQIAAWSAASGELVNLLAGALESTELPALEDYDQDRVLELIVRQTDSGDARTGPLRTGFTVYDWNGVLYVRSIVRLNPARFTIQIIHDADAAFRQGALTDAIALYTLALTDPDLAEWLPDDEEVLAAYALYRSLIAYAAQGDPAAGDVAAAARSRFPDPASAPVYMTLLETFWAAYSAGTPVSGACAAVNGIIAGRPDAIDRLNRYGSASPTYTAGDLCPFAE